MTTDQIVLSGEGAAITAFDYSTLDLETRIVVQQKTSEIKERIQRSASSIIEIGARLSEVRAKLEGGSFDGWLKTEFDWSRRTAYNFIGVHEQFGRANFAQLDIAASALYLLAAPSTPPEAREAALGRAKAGEKVTHGMAQMLIEEYKPEPPAALPLPDVPADLETRGWAFRRMRDGKLYMINDQHGGSTNTYATAGEAELAARDLDRRLAKTKEIAPPAPVAEQTLLPGLPSDEEIAVAPAPPAAAPVLTPRTPTAAPVVLTSLTPLPTLELATGTANRKLLACKRALLAATLAQVEADLALLAQVDVEQARPTPAIVVDARAADAAARSFLHSQGLNGAASMLAFSAMVEEETT